MHFFGRFFCKVVCGYTSPLYVHRWSMYVYTQDRRALYAKGVRCVHTRALCIHMEHTCTHKPSTRCIHEALTASGSWIWQLKKKTWREEGFLQEHQVRTGRQASKALLGSVAWTDKWKGEPAKWRTTGLSEDGYRLHLDRRSTNGPHTSSTTGAMANMFTPGRHMHRCAPPLCTHTKPRVYTKHRPVYTHISCIHTRRPVYTHSPARVARVMEDMRIHTRRIVYRRRTQGVDNWMSWIHRWPMRIHTAKMPRTQSALVVYTHSTSRIHTRRPVYTQISTLVNTHHHN